MRLGTQHCFSESSLHVYPAKHHPSVVVVQHMPFCMHCTNFDTVQWLTYEVLSILAVKRD